MSWWVRSFTTVLLCTLLPAIAFGAGASCLEAPGDGTASQHLLIHVEASHAPANARPSVLAETARILEDRLRRCGIETPSVAIVADDALEVQVPAAWSLDEANMLLGRQAVVDFREERIIEGQSEWIIATGRGRDGSMVPLAGEHLLHTELAFEPATNRPQILFGLDAEGAELLAEITTRLVSRRLGIFLDGAPLVTPVIQQAVTGGQGRITGTFRADEARILAVQLASGPLPAPVWIEPDGTELVPSNSTEN